MHFRNSKKGLIYMFRQNCRFLSVHQSIKCNNSDNLTKFYNTNFNQFSCSPISKCFPRTILCSTHIPALQRRDISSNVSDIKNVNGSTLDSPIFEEAVDLAVPTLSKFVKFVSDSKIVELTQSSLLKVHEITGLPWWASIVVTSFAARIIVTLPLHISQIRNAAKLEIIQVEMKDTAQRLQMEAVYLSRHNNWPESWAKANYYSKIREEYNNLIIRDNCHPAKNFILLLIQIPMWVAFSFSTRNLCFMLPVPDTYAQLTYLELTVGGFGWVKNLTSVDNYLILPCTIGLLNLSLLEIHRLFKPKKQMKFEKWIKILLRILIVTTAYFATYLPAATNIYWMSSSLYGLIQVFITNSTRLRRLCKIPIVQSESKHPYKFFYNNLRAKLLNKAVKE
ncbi:PREDICTED: mitochondrial inner membrane protein COX18 [Ceratosolen solmsi marchali]|uniref:Mitochondrial inner membrane protein COX18 n=1 Tax=Ceratosolen solmsi marchali TaxID=326594 RepID=A0AAJ7DXE9_9HYME|nr:PREDICTED: mitochondrial inner membrane protein COX18 [Ceratosolen solmsi marchali]